MPGTVPAVELAGITKRFPAVVANDDVHLRVLPGTIHAIVGENGAGKSTLMKILYGLQRPDAGTIRLDGRAVELRSPRAAIAAGIGMVHQHFMLADNLTVLENVVLGSEPRRGLTIDAAAARARILELAGARGAALQPDRLVEDLGVGERQLVEIVKVLYRGARVLILDEPTAALVPQEVDELFASLRALVAQGRTVIFISHKLEEVLAIADSVTVLRDGRSVATVSPAATTARQLAELMVGSDLPSPERGERIESDEVLLAVNGLGVRTPDGRELLHDVSFEVRRSQIVGIAGVEGNGQAELIDAIMGLVTASEGTVRLAGRDVTKWSTRRRREAGIGHIPEDAQREALLPPSPLWENCILGHHTKPAVNPGVRLDRGAARRAAQRIVSEFAVQTPGVQVPAHALSGGNQQKLVVGREITHQPRVLVAAHPTRGVDVGAQRTVWQQLRRARSEGLGVLLASADLDELLGLSDVLLVLFRGRVVARLDPGSVTAAELGEHMTGARAEGAA